MAIDLSPLRHPAEQFEASPDDRTQKTNRMRDGFRNGSTALDRRISSVGAGAEEPHPAPKAVRYPPTQPQAIDHDLREAVQQSPVILVEGTRFCIDLTRRA
ncbi:hypothetical protein ACBY01_01560 [Sphingomonas sp. ac-8]|uniref:hypothetical protein n=1 Tax=Sphingomonas sp. ac-8 TaxID=3242977 RepID=UPI003A7FE6B8